MIIGRARLKQHLKAPQIQEITEALYYRSTRAEGFPQGQWESTSRKGGETKRHEREKGEREPIRLYLH